MVDTPPILKELVDTAVQILVLNQIYLTEKVVVMARGRLTPSSILLAFLIILVVFVAWYRLVSNVM